MKKVVVPPKPFFYKGGEKAVLLLHSIQPCYWKWG